MRLDLAKNGFGRQMKHTITIGEWVEDMRATEWNDWGSYWRHCGVCLEILCPAA